MHQIVASLLIALTGLTGVAASASESAIVGYLPEYRIDGITPEQIEPLTHLVYFGIEPPADGRLPANPIAPDLKKRLAELGGKAGCKVSLCIGGWGRSANFAPLAKSPEARDRFISALMKLCKEVGLDGVDYDWEHPEGATQLANYARLLSETAAAFDTAGLEVTVAQAAWQDLGEEVYRAVDRVHLMSYDHEFPQATFEKSRADVERLTAWGCPPAKIALGLPFYGRDAGRKSKTYRELVAEETGGDVDQVGGYAFNGKDTIAKKVAFAKERGLAGVMIWEVGQDSPRPASSLLRVIAEKAKSPPPPAER